MPSKVSNSKTDAKGASKPRRNAPAGDASASSRASKSAAAEPAAPVAPRPPAEAVSLIEPKKKKVRKTEEGDRKVTALPRIGASAPKAVEKVAPAPAPAPEPEKEKPVVLDLLSAPAPRQAAAPKPEPEPAPEAELEPVAELSADNRKIIHIKPPIVVRDLAAQLDLKPFQVIADLMELNIFASITQSIEPEVAAKVCEKHGAIFEREKRKTGEGVHKVEAVIVEPKKKKVEEVKPSELQLRPPIITMMGHVDHGKTSLLDAIRKARVAASEAGGITQHIGAYSVKRGDSSITFLDTPGHAAFTAMRARGANVTDIVVLVVAADDGLMPQTIEAINHAKAAKVTIMVAINKIDLPGANVDKVKGQLQEHGLQPEDWGGETICCEVSATKGTGIDNLLENMALQAEVLELKANPLDDPRCTVIEAQIEAGRGPTATVIVNTGTLKVGQPFISGNYWGKVKQLIDDHGKPVKEAGPAMPVKVLGFSGLPKAGDELVAMDSERDARTLSEERLEALRTHKLTVPHQRTTLESLFDSMAENQRKNLQIVLKSDVQGSLEALTTSLGEIKSDKITLDILHGAVGPITESDVLLSSASNAVIVGFSVKVENGAAQAAKREGVQIKLYSIIYELIDQIKEAMAGMLDPELRESVVGHAEVKQVFDLSKGRVAGCMVIDGRIARTARARVLRKRQPIYDGGLATLRRFTDEVKEVRAGLECGIKLGDFTEYEAGDIIEAYTLEKIAQTL
jgi:translation initiation factor IF-2